MMKEDHTQMIRLSSYEDWHHCIEIECGIPLTPEFIEMRLNALRNPSDLHTQKFLDEWGQAHLNQVIHWFEMARSRV